MRLYLRRELAAAWAGRDVFEELEQLRGEVYRHKEGRKTLRFELGGRGYFLKLHRGVGWGEIFKNLVQLRLPVIGAANEWRAIEACRERGIATLAIAGYGQRGLNPATTHSFLITDELRGVVSIEDFCRKWQTVPPPYAVKRALVERVATISRQFHDAGINHRDFYLCHFLLAGEPERNPEAVFTAPIHLIDLHRAQLRRRVPRRWLIKDLGALYYSAHNLGFGRREVIRFLRGYLGAGVARHLARNQRFWQAVRRRAAKIHRRDFGTPPRLPL